MLFADNGNLITQSFRSHSVPLYRVPSLMVTLMVVPIYKIKILVESLEKNLKRILAKLHDFDANLKNLERILVKFHDFVVNF